MMNAKMDRLRGFLQSMVAEAQAHTDKALLECGELLPEHKPIYRAGYSDGIKFLAMAFLDMMDGRK